jgi:hypothetical protein
MHYRHLFPTLLCNTSLGGSKKSSWEWNGIHLLLVYSDDKRNTVKKIVEALIDSREEFCLEVNTENLVDVDISSPE